MGTRFRLARPTELSKRLRNAATPEERKLWAHLRRSQLGGYKFSRQLPIAGYVADLVCRRARLVIELDGGQHGCQVHEDALRTAAIERAGYRVIRFWNNEVRDNLAGVLDAIARTLASACPPPAPSRKREGKVAIEAAPGEAEHR